MKLKKWFMSALFPTFISIFPIALLYSNNADEVAPREILPILALLVGFALNLSVRTTLSGSVQDQGRFV